MTYHRSLTKFGKGIEIMARNKPKFRGMQDDSLGLEKIVAKGAIRVFECYDCAKFIKKMAHKEP